MGDWYEVNGCGRSATGATLSLLNTKGYLIGGAPTAVAGKVGAVVCLCHTCKHSFISSPLAYSCSSWWCIGRVFRHIQSNFSSSLLPIRKIKKIRRLLLLLLLLQQQASPLPKRCHPRGYK